MSRKHDVGALLSSSLLCCVNRYLNISPSLEVDDAGMGRTRFRASFY